MLEMGCVILLWHSLGLPYYYFVLMEPRTDMHTSELHELGTRHQHLEPGPRKWQGNCKCESGKWNWNYM